MSIISKILESYVDVVRMVKVLRNGENDTVNTYQIGSFGEDSNVPAEYKGLYINTGNSEEPVCVGFINKVVIDDLAAGEKQLFSTNEGGDSIEAYIKLKNDGTMHFNGDADNLTGFTELESGFNTLKDDLNTLINIFNAHIHVTTATIGLAPVGAIAATATTGTPTTADISASKKDNLKCE